MRFTGIPAPWSSLGLAAVLLGSLLGGANPAECQVPPPILRAAVVDGKDVRLSWTGMPSPNGTWTLTWFDLDALWENEPIVDFPVLYSGTDTTFVHVHDLAAWPQNIGYFVNGAGQSNMAFRWETSFPAPGPGTWTYLVSLPLQPGVEDTADAALGAWPCAGSGNGDGELRFEDVPCSLFTDRAAVTDGSFEARTLSHWTCSFVGATATVVSGAPVMTGADDGQSPRALDDPDVSDRGYFVTVTVPAGQPPIVNRAVIAGSYSNAYSGRSLQIGAGCPFDVGSLPYHTYYRTLDEVLCGLRGVDWVDLDGDGPDTCPSGVYAGGRAPRVTAQAIVPETQSWVARHVVTDPVSGALRFLGTNHALRLGEAYLITAEAGCPGCMLFSPHY